MHTQTHTPTHVPNADRRFVDPDTLTCPGCGERPVRCAPPEDWPGGVAVPVFSHQDASPLCRTRSGVVADPIETVR
jgi:hypothetical protein